MEISGIVTAVVLGAVIGALGRLVLPGRQNIGWLWTIGVGVAAALVGTAIATVLGVADTKGPDWIEWFIQIGLAALGVSALERYRSRS